MGFPSSYRFALAFSAVGATLLAVGLIFLIVAMTSSQASLHTGSEVMMIAVVFSGVGVLCLVPSLIVFLVRFIMKRCGTTSVPTKTEEMPAYHFSRPVLYFSHMPPEMLAQHSKRSGANQNGEHSLQQTVLPLLSHVSQRTPFGHSEPPIAQSEVSSALIGEDDRFMEEPFTENLDESTNNRYEEEEDDEEVLRSVSYYDIQHASSTDEPDSQVPEMDEAPPAYDSICHPPRLHAMTLV